MQRTEWDPVVEWWQQRFNAKLVVSEELFVPYHPEPTLKAAEAYINSFSPWQSYGVTMAIETLRSFVLGSAVIEGLLSSLQAGSAEDFQRWLDLATLAEPLNRDVEYQATLDGERLRGALLLGVGDVPSPAPLSVVWANLKERQLRPRAQLLANAILSRLYFGKRIPKEAVDQLARDARVLLAQCDVDVLVSASVASLRSSNRGAEADALQTEFFETRRDRLPVPDFFDGPRFRRPAHSAQAVPAARA